MNGFFCPTLRLKWDKPPKWDKAKTQKGTRTDALSMPDKTLLP